MGKKFLLVLLWIGFPYTSFSQSTSITGSVVDSYSLEEITSVKILIEGTFLETESDANGLFIFSSEDIPEGNQVLVFTKSGYARQRMPVVIIKGETKNLGEILLTRDLSEEQRQIGTISLSDNELNEEEGSFDNLSGLLQASRDVFLNAAAYDFSATFFRPRGFDSENGKLLINGIEMNKIFNGRPQWSNWGGLNDVQRTQVFSMGISPSEVSFGGLAGTTNIIMRASEYGEGGRISYAASNRSYTGRVMATYNSGELPAGWAYSLSISRRYAQEGYVEGTLYDANSVFLAVEKELSKNHSLNFTAFYTPNIRGKSSANTQEVFDLKGRRYNSFWGYQDNEIRNSRLREIKEPIFMLNHYWQISENVQLNNNAAYQFGSVGNSRIDFGGTNRVVFNDQESFVGGGANPDPAYYQKLPGYFLRFEDNANYEAAYRAQQDFTDNGQIDWPSLYRANLNEAATGGNSIYVIAEDRNDDNLVTANTILTARLKQNVEFNAKISYTSLKSENFASVKDLLGGTGYLDIDFFAEGTTEMSQADAAQSDLRNRNRIVTEGERFKYNYELFADIAEAFAQVQYKLNKVDFFVAGNISQTAYQRNGLFQNGTYADNSFGKSERLNFTNFGLKSGATYKLSGRHLFTTNLAYYTKAPNLRNSFSNSRQNNETVVGLESEKFRFGDLSYRFRSPKLNLRFTGYYAEILDATEISFYYADGLSGLGRTGTTAFVQEVLTGIDKQHLGMELGAESQITSTIKLKAAAALGQYIYANNPILYLTSSSFDEAVNYGTSYLKNYHIPGGPQRAAQLGFEYRDPDYWWFGTTVNFFSHGFADVSPLTRTANFRTDADGLPILSYDETLAKSLLKQEQFQDYVLVNAIGGKSWRIKDRYLGFFCSLNNIFDVLYKTGGYEQSRNANFMSLKQDRERDQPLFASRYWYGNGTTYYINFYLRF
ncbi:carboxypeptidase-like regulatory domain-containing protein [Salegentibacter sp. F188]|uniref:Carboxypeptidase-like regulatory domain-containing protein n=1 Tax=Autumnicola patrickiae TaxID=3075591 RepID=A0ABU3E5J3_9FLAO|nr:carboxypeptidase-like regulatory domain-containing protein [Salegentibacter sp. F188]MDT0691195.1 carboxypeptidase-like regulatory domain-containing protein [Salegentibacter sp. F188]